METVVLFPLFPAALTAEQHRQQILYHQHATVFSVFLLWPSAENEAKARETHRLWIASFLDDGEEAKADHRFFVHRLACISQGAAA